MKFPKLIHVVVEAGGDKPSDDFLMVQEQGVMGVDEPNRPIAVYQLVSEGHVSIQKAFVEKRRKR